jgi:hypothetical protein
MASSSVRPLLTIFCSRGLRASFLVLALAGCSLGNVKHDACAQNSECAAAFGPGSECSNNYCTESVKCNDDSQCAQGICRAGYCSSGSCEGKVNGRPCFDCTPKENVEFLNGCTNAACESFDRARLTNLPADGKLPPLP